ncbi:flagellin [Vibrio fluvialis]|nr:flagellin [Vibrio fluvialis]EKO3521338.1 flagellin [Vibrio fluvialis]EKO3525303.1 flagellin [Vibrio fluvialis]EKO3544521.1 flagellin [Vibrio fluvialis]ELP3314344.1 flagellin [Vibrio fluvialis]
MAMSTVEVRPHGIRLTGQEQASITPSRSSDSARLPARQTRALQADTTSAYSVSGVLLTQGQQQATSVQIASKSLQFVGKELTTIKRGLTQAMTQGADNVPNLKETLTRSKMTIEAVLDQARFDGQRVVDNELNLKLDRADIRRFSIPGLNVNRLKEKAEQIRLDFPQGNSVMIQFDGQSDGSKTVKMLDRSLIPLGIRASVTQDGNIVFEAKESAYKQMKQKVMVTGQGHRFPAGQANTLNLKSEPDGIAELRFDLSSRDGIKQGIAKVNQHLAQAQTSLEQARQYHSELNTQMQTLRSQTRLLSSEQTTEKLTQFHAAADQFSSTYQALNAQANVRRHTVVALLR